MLNVQETTDWITNLQKFGIRPGLERVTRVLEVFENLQDSMRFYHVAGTNGKGSVCAMLDSMLRASGYRTGLFTSPGFGGFTGRMTMNGTVISDEEFAYHASRVKSVVEQVLPLDPLTEFEVLMVVALLFFHARGANEVVWETGLGGRFDSTNIVQPAVTAITNVSLDHVDILGPTLSHIAFNKAGIIKPGVPVVTGVTRNAYRVIEDVARRVGAPIVRVGNDIAMTEIRHARVGWQGFYRGIYRDAGGVTVALRGRHQLTNAAIAMAMFEIGVGASATTMWRASVDSLRSVHWPMRFEVFREAQNRPVVLDGAHNVGAAEVLAKALNDFSRVNGTSQKWKMVVGVLADKDSTEMLRQLLPLASSVIVCSPNHRRALAAGELANHVRTLRQEIPIRQVSDVAQAVGVALDSLEPLAIWGSLYMVEDARKTISKLGMEYWT